MGELFVYEPGNNGECFKGVDNKNEIDFKRSRMSCF